MDILNRSLRHIYTVRFKLIISVALIHFVLMTSFIVSSIDRQREDIELELTKRANGLAKMLSVMSVNAVLSEDLGSLVEYVEAVIAEPDVVYVTITDRDDTVLSASDHGLDGKKISIRGGPESFPLPGDDSILDIVVPIVVKDNRIGAVSIGISTERMSNEISNVKKNGYIVILLAMVIGSVSAWVLSVFVTRSLHKLMKATDAIKKGDLNVRSGVSSRDEIGHLALTFDAMAESLQNDINELRRAGTEIAYLNRLNSHIVENVSHAVCLLDRNKNVMRSNGRFHLIEDNIGSSFPSLPVLGDKLRAVAENKVPVLDLEFSYSGRDGNTKLLLINISPLLNEDNDVVFYLLEIKDVTEQRALEQQLLYSARFACMGQLATGIAHEIRNPLTGIRLGLDTLKRVTEQGGDGGFQPVIDDIVRDIERLDRLILQLLNFARKRETVLELLDINEVIERALFYIMQQARQQDVSVVKMIDGVSHKIRADKDRIQQVFLNLLLNSLQSMPSGGEIRIIAGEDFRVFRNRQERGIRVTIEDTGPGIPEKYIDQVFNPFFTTKETGTGLGLSICQKIVQDHNGVITIRNRDGGGVSVDFFLPEEGGSGVIEENPHYR